MKMNLKCNGCLSDVSLMTMKKIGSKRYCAKCYSYIVSALKGINTVENDDTIPDDEVSKKSDDEGSRQIRFCFDLCY